MSNKNIIKIAINLPIKYKINKTSDIKSKIILKKIFLDIFNKSLLLNKIGFSGFPNETINLLSNKEKNNFKSILSKIKTKRKIDKSLEWKFLNLFYFKKFLYNDKKININNYNLLK